MTRTPVLGLVATGGFIAVAMAVITWSFYGSMMSIPITFSLTMWIMSLVCVGFAWKVRDRLSERLIGQDRSQLNPVTAAMFLVLGKASAWTGAIVGGAYIGIATYVIPHVGDLVAASEDLPGVLSSSLGGIALSAAGLYLERHCETPPPTEGELVR